MHDYVEIVRLSAPLLYTQSGSIDVEMLDITSLLRMHDNTVFIEIQRRAIQISQRQS